jgi:hypothetical protein
VHLLMARGAAEFETLFPGLLERMVADGVPILENRPDCIHFGAAGHVLGTRHTLRDEFTAYVPSRPHLEWQIRRRVQDIANVEIRHRLVTEPTFDAVRGRVTGVRTDDGGTESAELTVDATGRGTRLPMWLRQWGFQPPPEDTVDVGIDYSTHRVRIPEGSFREKVVVAGASRSQPLGLGMLYYEDGIWGLTTFGTARAQPPGDFAGMVALAQEVLPAHVAAALAQRTAKTTFPVWTMNAIGDQVLHNAPGPRPWWFRPVGSLFDQFLGAAETDPVLAEWFLRRFSLLDSLYMVPSAGHFSRTGAH